MAPKPPGVQFIRTVTALVSPLAAASAALMVLGALPPVPRLIAAGACGVVIPIMVWRHLRDLAALRRLSEDLAQQPPEEPPAIGERSLVADIDRTLRRQRRDLHALLAGGGNRRDRATWRVRMRTPAPPSPMPCHVAIEPSCACHRSVTCCR